MPLAKVSSAKTPVNRTFSNNLVLRKQQLDRLKNHSAVRLIVVQGPAGFGKTTLLRQYCEHRRIQGSRIAWVHMEPHSSDPAHFLRLLCDAVWDARENSDALHADGEGAPASVKDFVRATRGVEGGMTVVIDNFEQASHPGLEAVIAQLVRVLPAGAQLCLGTRIIPAINLPRLQLREQAIVVNVEGLRFRASETTEFFKEFRDLAAEEIDDIQRATDGWPAALQCIRLSLRGGRSQRVSTLAGTGVTPDLIDFLATDVFDNLSEANQRVLLDACMPERICPELLEHISGRTDGRKCLDEIEHSGLFLNPIDSDHHWYRFHIVFRQVLLTRLRREVSEAEIVMRQKRIAEWYSLHGFREEAILHYLEANDEENAAEILNSVIERLVTEERLDLIVRYVDQLSDDVIQKYEEILKAAIVAYGFRRQFVKATRIANAREAILKRDNASSEKWGIHNYTLIFIYAAQDKVDDIGRVADKTLELLTEEHCLEYAVGLNAKAFWLLANNKFEEAREVLSKARALHDEAHNFFGLSYCEWIYSTVLTGLGRNEEAIKSLKHALSRTESGAGTSIAAGAVIAAYLAESLYEKNCIVEAETLLNDFSLLIEQQTIIDPVSVTFLTAARIAMLRGDEREAEEVLDRAMYLGHRYNLPRVVTYARAELVRQATLVGDIEKARNRFAALTANDGVVPDDEYMFHAGETEVNTVTHARLLVHSGRHAEARAMIQPELRKAKTNRRLRRAMKLNLLLAISLNMEGQVNSARRALIEALNIGAPDQFLRLFLDEGPQAVRLLKETRASLPKFPDIPQKDMLSAYLDRLLAEAGEFTPTVVEPETSDLDEGDFSPQLFERLTDREREILRLVSNGFSNKALADRLSLSTNTVKWHLRNIFEKLQIANRMQAVSVARHFGLIE
jgi:LuxR family maltose regulon positive regulatory protein